MKNNKRYHLNQKGFTFIEVLMALVLMSIMFLPVMNMFSVSLEQSHTLSEMTTAKSVAQEEMEKLKNLNFTVEQLKKQGNVWIPPLGEPPLKFNKVEWRTFREIRDTNGPLEVWIRVYKEKDLEHQGTQTNPVIEFVTLCQDLNW